MWLRKIPKMLYIKSWRRHFWGHAVAQAGSRDPLTAKARSPSQVSPCEICGGQSGNGAGFTPNASSIITMSLFSTEFHVNSWPMYVIKYMY
jgi:hypothetical protein